MKSRFAYFFLAVTLLSTSEASTQLVVIANSGVKVAEVSKADLRDIFTGVSSSLDGAGQVTPVLLKPGPAHDDFLNLYVGKSEAAFRASWRSLLFSGQAVMPKTLDSDAAVIEYVAHTPGAIAYIGKSVPHEGVKILVVR